MQNNMPSNNSNSFKLIGANSNGLDTKTKSLRNIISEIKPSCIMIQETKFIKKGKVKLEGFQVFELVRHDSEVEVFLQVF